MRGSIRIPDPNLVELELAVTMKLRDWKDLNKQLSTKYPSCKFGSLINTLVRKAEQLNTLVRKAEQINTPIRKAEQHFTEDTEEDDL